MFSSRASLLLLAGCCFCCCHCLSSDAEAERLEAAAVSSGQSADLDTAASDANSLLSSESHKVVASGWPSASSMWPTIDIDDEKTRAQDKHNDWFKMIQPFIYADKPRTGDYSLLLKINSTVLEALRAHLKPMSVELSFEYYFNHEPKSNALPLIKIEVNRKELKHLDPNSQNVKSRLWMKFSERIQIADLQQLERRDWLKISLVNRDEPSIVAIRQLRAEFQMASADPQPLPNNLQVPEQQPTLPEQIPQQPAVIPQQPPPQPQAIPEPPNQDQQPIPEQVPAQSEPYSPQPGPPTVDGSPGDQNEISNYPQQTESIPELPPPQQQQPLPEVVVPPGDSNQPSSYGPQDLQQSASEHKISRTTKPMEQSSSPATPTNDEIDPMTAASETLTSTIKPVTPAKKKGAWGWPGKRRRRRDTNGQVPAAPNPYLNASSIVLTCHQSDDCEWQSDTSTTTTTTTKGDDGIQWSLARMPTSTSTVQSGYYYNSNRNNYGDASKLLRVYLNQTERATIVDQNSDHCIDLAIYVTESSFLRMYRLTKRTDLAAAAADDASDDSAWVKGNLLMSWAPTLAINDTSLAIQRRVALPGSRLASMEPGRNGWTTESFCFGHFFAQPRECGAGKCALGFVMDTTPPHKSEPESDGPATMAGAEQVVGVSILREYSQNVPLPANTAQKWLQTWQREEVGPEIGWKFYPKLDYQISGNNVSLLNLYDDAHYFVESDWIQVNDHLDLTAALLFEDVSGRNLTEFLSEEQLAQHQQENGNVFSMKIESKLVDASFNNIHVNETQFDWNIHSIANGTASLSLNMSITDHLSPKKGAQKEGDSNLFKIVFEFVLDLHWLTPSASGATHEPVSEYLTKDGGSRFRISLLNVSVSDRCFPNQCEHGSCQQNGTGLEDWNCKCEDRYRGRRCEFGHWCNVPHAAAWNPPTSAANSNQQNRIALKIPGGRQPKLVESVTRVTGEQYCKSKLGLGYKCTDIDLPLNDNLYTDEEKTFYCSCKSDYYLSDDSRCRQTHPCNSVLCPSMGMICDETKPFNQTQPCHCNEKQDWFADPEDSSRCVRRQCQDKQRDCGFDAHLCIPTLPGEKPICKCGPKFTLRTNPESGKKLCQSTACVLPTLNDCQQVCVPDSSNMTRPYSCACHPGFQLEPADGRTCKPERAKTPHCRPSCPSESQICTDHGCRCKQGFVGEGEQKSRRVPNRASPKNNATAIEYTESVHCLNICALTYAENKEEFEMIESVCPLGLCDPTSFQCRCSDPSSAALANEKYEPIFANCSTSDSQEEELEEETSLVRVSPLCHLKRVCEPESSSYKVCKSQGAICVPDYTKPAKFDCICPPSSEKRFYGQATASEFTCESKCSSKKSDCLRKQAVCKQVDRDQVRCDCLPGFMLQDNVCYLARYSYSLNLMIVNKYYEPEAKFHKLIEFNSTNSMAAGDNRRPPSGSDLCPRKKTKPAASESDDKRDSTSSDTQQEDLHEHLSELVPQFNKIEGRSAAPAATKRMTKSIFIADYNQCNITQVIPKSVIEDPYEHDIESYLGYIEQCNEKIHQNMRNYHLNSRLSEDIRQSLRQHLRDFTVNTNNSSCIETDPSGMLLNCTIYLQANEPIDESTVSFVFNECDKSAHDNKYCWIKPRLLLQKKSQQHLEFQSSGANKTTDASRLNFKQIVPCELNNFCGPDAVSVRSDDRTSMCSCKCPADIEVIDVKDLESRRQDDEPAKVAVKEICAPRNHCGANSTHCLLKAGSVCQYDIRTGSRCICVHPSYEDSAGKCVEVAFSQLDSTLIVIIVMLGTGLLVSVCLNILVAARTRSMFGRSKQYPLNEFSAPASRPMNRSTGVPNPVFEHD